MKLVIVESPAKAKTINKYLGKDYEVLASFGHVRDLPAKDGSVDPDDDFAMRWEVDTASKKRLTDIAKAVKDADELILATDPDREGEAISWHVLDVLNQKKAIKGKPVNRVVFNAITKSAVTEAMAHPRDIDVPLVDAYLARRALDYLVGFTLSPVLWRKLPGSRSAGRVQSVALRLVCDREAEIEKFRPQEYWSVEATLTQAGKPFLARLYRRRRQEDRQARHRQRGRGQAACKSAIEAGSFRVESVEKKPTKRNPYPPFTTSTLQQDASFAARLRARRGPCRSPSGSMKASPSMARRSASSPICVPTPCRWRPRASIRPGGRSPTEFGDDYLPEKPRLYQTKAKNAQEAHEAIRPTDMFRTPETAQAARSGPAEALRADLAAHAGQPDEIGRDRAHHRRYRRVRRGDRR